jgi:hypothetical protein
MCPSYLRLIAGFMRRLFELHLELIATLERELAADERCDPAAGSHSTRACG